MNAATRASGEGNFDWRSGQRGGRARRNRATRIYNVLLVCPGDSTRARIGAALLRTRGGDKYRIFVATAGRRVQSDLQCETDKWLREANLNGNSIAEALLPNSPPMDFAIVFDDDSATEVSTSWYGRPEVMRWHISQPSHDGKPEDRERSFKRTLCELETRLSLFILVCEKSEREEAAAR
jgi:ArsR family transcriptional regulator, arsenate/arsenite/antimonite-responsive transcriptional repressor / arsenate reductase (thioredoxin)